MRHKHKAVLLSTADGHTDQNLEQHGSGFLTKAQQDVLDAAVIEKQKSAHLETAKSRGEEKLVSRQDSQGPNPVYKDRASRSKSDKLLGKPKKHGAGGKYNWGGTLDAEAVSGVQDPHDPNYDSGAEDTDGSWMKATPFLQTTNAKPQIQTILKEYLVSGNQLEAIASLQSVVLPDTAPWVGKKLVTMAMDHRDKERELASQLLSAVNGTVISEKEMEEAFILLLKAAEDLQLDVPQALDILAIFTARAAHDEILSPGFISAHITGADDLSHQILDKAAHLLKAPHSAQRLENCWGCADSSSYAQLVAGINSLLKEYASSNDIREVQMCLKRIDAPLSMHELVKQALTKAMADKCQDQIMVLLDKLASEGTISEDQILKGFKRVQNHLEDLTLDIPDAKTKFRALSELAIGQKWIPASALGSESTHKSLTEPNGTVDYDQENYQEASKTWSSSLQDFKKGIRAAVLEYFSSEDLKEVRRRIEDLGQQGFHSLAVKQVVQLAMEAKDRERELTAKLLTDLSKNLVSTDQLALGFKRLLAFAEDIALDIPAAPHHLSIFLGRLIVDELLPPAFLTNALDSLNNGSLGVEIIKAVGNTLKQRHAYQRLQDCWQPNSDVYNTRSKIQGLVSEYLQTGDVSEASRCWQDLGLPFYAHQLVWTILSADFGHPETHQQLFKLLGRLLQTGEVSETQLEIGFERVQQQLSDLQLDYPSAPIQFAKCKLEAEKLQWLQPSLPNGSA